MRIKPAQPSRERRENIEKLRRSDTNGVQLEVVAGHKLLCAKGVLWGEKFLRNDSKLKVRKVGTVVAGKKHQTPYPIQYRAPRGKYARYLHNTSPERVC